MHKLVVRTLEACVTPGSLPRTSPLLRTMIFLAWLATVLLLIEHHVWSRDEVRAWSIALQGRDVGEMLQNLRGEGHPFLWYVLLRGAHAMAPTTEAMQFLAFAIATASALIFAFLSPFRWPLILIFLAGGLASFEYAVMARNYGISMLLLFVLALLYSHAREQKLAIGTVLFLLPNTNVHCLIVSAGFMLFWSVDLFLRGGLRLKADVRAFLSGGAAWLAGAVVCLLTVLPTYNDAATANVRPTIYDIVLATFFPSNAFLWITPARLLQLLQDKGLDAVLGIATPLVHLLSSALLFGTILGLVRRPAAFLAGLTTLLIFAVFFSAGHPGYYRHAGLWLVFILTLYWIIDAHPNERTIYRPSIERYVPITERIGRGAFLLLLMFQIAGTVRAVSDAVRDHPLSRSHEVAKFIADRPQYQDAILIADPDYMLESVRGYVRNPTYLMRERRFGEYVIFTKNAQLTLTLDEILAHAARLRHEERRPVLILMSVRLRPDSPAERVPEGYNWELLVHPDQVTRFLQKTRRLATFPPARRDESYDLYEYMGEQRGAAPIGPGNAQAQRPASF